MTEQEFDRRAEELAARFERRVEASADRLDRGLTRKYDESRWFRIGVKGLSAAAGVGLLVGARRLADGGRGTAAGWCAGLGVVVLAAALLQGLLLKRRA